MKSRLAFALPARLAFIATAFQIVDFANATWRRIMTTMSFATARMKHRVMVALSIAALLVGALLSGSWLFRRWLDQQTAADFRPIDATVTQLHLGDLGRIEGDFKEGEHAFIESSPVARHVVLTTEQNPEEVQRVLIDRIHALDFRDVTQHTGLCGSGSLPCRFEREQPEGWTTIEVLLQIPGETLYVPGQALQVPDGETGLTVLVE